MDKTATFNERQTVAAHTQTLFAWAAQACATPLPPHIRRRAATILADDVGAMVAGSLEPQVAKACATFVRTSSAAQEATILAPGAAVVDRYAAACANGMSITWCELDEGFRNASCHAGAYTLPALLAEAQACNASVEQVLRAVAVAYEVTTRFALTYPFPSFYVHPHAAFAALGAAVAVSLVRGHDAQLMQDSVTAAASMTFAGPFDTAVEGSLVRNAWTSAGAWVGMRAADWAQAGIGGGIHTPYDVFATNLRTRCLPDQLIAGLGERWSVSNGYHKIFACCNYAHAAVEASLSLRSQLGQRTPADIAEIRVEAGPAGLSLSTVEPQTVLAAKFSMPHAVAATTLRGTGGATSFTFDTLSDPAIAALRRRVKLAAYADAGPPPRDRPARVTWTFQDGEQCTATVENPRGGADQPFDEPTLLSKLAENIGDVLPQAPAWLARLIEGDEALMAQGWREAMAHITQGARP
jgi:2-methylcitrate dehydratase PrpD